jgi:hypothetical protein
MQAQASAFKASLKSPTDTENQSSSEESHNGEPHGDFASKVESLPQGTLREELNQHVLPQERIPMVENGISIK